MKQDVASFLLMARRAFCQAMLEQHIYFAGLSHCAFRNGSNLSSIWWLWKSLLPFFFFFLNLRIFFSLSKRNIMTSTCPPLPLQHILREVHIFTENMFKARLLVAPARSSQSALRVPVRQEVSQSRADVLMYLFPPGDCEVLKVGTILLHLHNPCG